MQTDEDEHDDYEDHHSKISKFLTKKVPKYRRLVFRMNFFRCVILHLVTTSIFGGLIISSLSTDVSYVDGLFLAASAVSGTGLGTVEMKALSPGSLVTIYIIMFMGGTVILLIPPIIYRRAVFSALLPSLRDFVDAEGRSDLPSVNALVAVLRKRELLHRALHMTLLALLLYLGFWVLLGSFIMYAISLRYPDPPELVERGFSKLWSSSFLTASSFFNCGYTLTSDRQEHFPHEARTLYPLSNAGR